MSLNSVRRCPDHCWQIRVWLIRPWNLNGSDNRPRLHPAVYVKVKLPVAASPLLCVITTVVGPVWLPVGV